MSATVQLGGDARPHVERYGGVWLWPGAVLFWRQGASVDRGAHLV
jgi:hypothetical protein